MDNQYETTVDLFVDLAKGMLVVPVKTIVEIGARDCRETLRFHDMFPGAMIHTFTCNPENLPLCRTAVRRLPNIVLIEKAVTNTGGVVKFYKMDTRRTTTT